MGCPASLTSAPYTSGSSPSCPLHIQLPAQKHTADSLIWTSGEQ